MVHFGWREGDVIGMTHIARRTGWQMSQGLAECRSAVVTGCAGPRHNALMRITGGLPGDSGVAGIALLNTGRDMGCRLDLCVDRNITSVVAGDAVSAGSAVVHQPRRKGNKTGMTGVALSCCGNVSR